MNAAGTVVLGSCSLPCDGDTRPERRDAYQVSCRAFNEVLMGKCYSPWKLNGCRLRSNEEDDARSNLLEINAIQISRDLYQ
jgi:hypothetical protein